MILMFWVCLRASAGPTGYLSKVEKLVVFRVSSVYVEFFAFCNFLIQKTILKEIIR